METPMAFVTMLAVVCRVQRCALCVRDCCSGMEVVVHSDCACHFRPGERICIHYNGAMTRSIPPQITAACIERVNRC